MENTEKRASGRRRIVAYAGCATDVVAASLVRALPRMGAQSCSRAASESRGRHSVGGDSFRHDGGIRYRFLPIKRIYPQHNPTTSVENKWLAP